MRKLIAALALLSLPATASAGVLGFSFGAGYDYWQADPSGTTALDGAEIDLEDNLKLDTSSEGQLWAFFEHPLPIIPDFRIQQGGISTEGDGGSFTVTATTPFGDFDADATNVETSLDLAMTDFIVYWSPLPEGILTAGIMSIDLGLNFRQISGDLHMTGEAGGETQTVDESFNATIPLGYLSARANIPGTGISLGGAMSALKVGNNGITDTTFDLSWRSGLGLGVRGGVRSVEFVLEDAGDIEFDMTFNGAFIGGFYHF